MKMKLKSWIFLIVSGICFAAESTDAEILKDLDFFMSVDMVGNDAAMDDAEGDFIDEAGTDTSSPQVGNPIRGASK
jgi:hypothetical protein